MIMQYSKLVILYVQRKFDEKKPHSNMHNNFNTFNSELFNFKFLTLINHIIKINQNNVEVNKLISRHKYIA